MFVDIFLNSCYKQRQPTYYITEQALQFTVREENEALLLRGKNQFDFNNVRRNH